MSRDEFSGWYLSEQGLELPPSARIEVTGRLVQYQNAGLARQHPRQTGATFLPVTQVMRGAVAEARQPGLREGLLHTRLHRALAQSHVLGAEGHVLLHTGAG